MIKKIIIVIFFASVIFVVSACSSGKLDSDTTTDIPTSTTTDNQKIENLVKIRKIDVREESITPQHSRKNVRSNRSNTVSLLSNADEKSNSNYVVIYRSQTDITFTIQLDNPEAYGIDDIRITCDDSDSKIWLSDTDGSGAWKPIQREADGTSVIGWGSSDRYERTYKIRTTSIDAINLFKVVDVRLAGHEKFQSKETNSTDLGNNELKIYKMDDDAYTINVFERTFEYNKFSVEIKDANISNFMVNGEPANEDGYWIAEDSNIEISYDYYLSENNLLVSRTERKEVKVAEFLTGYFSYWISVIEDDLDNYESGFTFAAKGNPDFSVYRDGIKYEFMTSWPIFSDENIGDCYYFRSTVKKTDYESKLDSIYFYSEADLIEYLNYIIIEFNGIKYKVEFKTYMDIYNSEQVSYQYAQAEITGIMQLES